MTQYYRPDEDISNAGLWTTEPLYSKINEESSPDTAYITSPVNADHVECIVGLPDVTNPGIDTDHILRFRAKKNKTQSMYVNVELVLDPNGTSGGPTVIAATNLTDITQSFAEYSVTLTTTQASNITDYSDLGVAIYGDSSAGKAVDCSWVQFEVPDEPTTVTNCQLVISETWKTSNNIKVIVSGAWKSVSSMKTVMSETWKDVF